MEQQVTKLTVSDVYFPLGKNSKQPFTKWTTHFESQPIPEGYNVGMRCLRTVVVDTDNDLTTKLALTMLPPTAMVKTRKGVHLYYAGTMTGKKNMHKIDVIGTGGYVVAPPSIVDGHKYEFITDCKKTQWSDDILRQTELIAAIAYITDEIIENYVQGKRDELIFALAGLLYKSDIDINIAKTVVNYITTTTNDEEAQSRINVVEHTYKQPKVKVVGAKILRNYNIQVPRIFTTRINENNEETGINTINEPKPKKRMPILMVDLFDYMEKRYKITSDVWDGGIFIDGERFIEGMHLIKIFGEVQYDLKEQYTIRKEQVLDAILYISQKNKTDWLLDELERCYKLYVDNYDNDKIDVTKAPLEIAKAIKASNVESAAKKLEFFFCQAVKRAYEPGAFAKVSLILKGDQSVGKSGFARIMAFDKGHTSVSYVNEYNERDEEQKISSAWLVEFEEGFALTKGDMLFMKGFLSRTEAKFVKKYERTVTVFKRRSCFIFTTNESMILKDSTGEERFTVIEITDKIDFDAVKFWRDLFIGHCVKIYKENAFNPMIMPEFLKEDKDDFKAIDDIYDVVVDTLLGKGAKHPELIQVKRTTVYVKSLLLAQLVTGQNSINDIHQSIFAKIKQAMELLGFTKKRATINGKKTVFYVCSVKKFVANVLSHDEELTLDNVIAAHSNASSGAVNITEVINAIVNR